MSLRMIEAVKRLPVSPTQKLVLFCLADCHNEGSERCDPSVTYIMQITGLSNRAIATALQELEKGGNLQASRQNGARSRYLLTPKTSEERSRVILEPPNFDDPKPVKHVHGLNGKPVNEVHQRSTFTSEPPAKTSEPPSLEPVNLLPKPVKEVHTNRKEPEVQPEGTGKRETDLEAPLPFASLEFQEAWKSWKSHRSEIRKPLKPTMMAACLRELAKMGESRAIAAIEHTIFKGWQGIREPEQQQQWNGQSRHPKHKAYNQEDATRGKTPEQIGVF
jgi:hypothetical protein